MQPWEAEPIAKIAKDNQLTAYKHRGFWQPMDTLAEKKLLNKLYENDEAPWKSWK
jgi:glucose-1-phosphate cytidylyltransferase